MRCRHARRAGCRASAALLVVLALLPVVACAQDALSGTYAPKEPSVGQPAGASTPEAALRVVRQGGGWSAFFNGRPLQLLPVRPDGLDTLFPDVPREVPLQCAATDAFMLCHVTPGTRMANGAFTATTGYFAILADGPAFELVRVPAVQAAPRRPE